MSEVAYYFTNLVSAKSFIIDLDAKSLSIDAVEFQESMEAAREACKATGVEPSRTLDQTETLAGLMDSGPSRKTQFRETDIRGALQADQNAIAFSHLNTFFLSSFSCDLGVMILKY